MSSLQRQAIKVLARPQPRVVCLPAIQESNIVGTCQHSSLARGQSLEDKADQYHSLASRHVPVASLSLLFTRTQQNEIGRRTRARSAQQPWYRTLSTTRTLAPIVHDVFEPVTGSWQYVVADPSTKAAVLIDPVLNYDPNIGLATTESADQLLSVVKEHQYKVDMILETHAHADHLTAASYLKHCLASEQGDLDTPIICIGRRIDQIQKRWGERDNISASEYEGVFDKVFCDDETFNVGELCGQVLHLPGHTPDLIGYKMGDSVFVGDTVFITDLGSARADFPGGSLQNLYRSCRKVLSLPDHVNVYTGHDYPSESRPVPLSNMKVGHHRKNNIHLKDGITEAEFIKMRSVRDGQLAEPRLLHQSLQMNIRAGRLPAPTATAERLRLLHTPLKTQVTW